jgi:hypothetical protein
MMPMPMLMLMGGACNSSSTHWFFLPTAFNSGSEIWFMEISKQEEEAKWCPNKHKMMSK